LTPQDPLGQDALGQDFLGGIVVSQKEGRPCGITSVCSAHPLVIQAAVQQCLEDGQPLLVESTVNQVNQLGGYTGLTPRDFRAFVAGIAAKGGLPAERLLLGGDHLGPYSWRAEPAAAAMARACELVAACVRAGYGKLHLDASMPLGGDIAGGHGGQQPRGRLDPRLVAEREAEMAAAAEAAFAGLVSRGGRGSSSPVPPVYVIGTDVPLPGGTEVPEEGGEGGAEAGADGGGEAVAVTPVEELRQTFALCREAFARRHLEAAWGRVRAVVVQPGVEFGEGGVQEYDRRRARKLCAAARELPGIVLEGHSTDYQRPEHLRQLVEDGVAVLKVGPALSFAMRECLFSLELIEREMLGGSYRRRLSELGSFLEKAMTDDPRHWQGYYRGSDTEKRLARRYSFSDRCRYYWTVPMVEQAVQRLLANLRQSPPPLALLSQFMPLQYRKIREGRLAARPEDLVRDGIREVLRGYSQALRAG
jgi:D-tagatose-1,6-bisphosphate aldolase subunit GatZ/KbaZ